MPLIIEVKTIPQKDHRYPTLGDYVGHERLRFIQVSEMGNAKYEFLIALHEMIEQSLCLERGIPEQSITDFDIAFEDKRLPDDDSEPGDDPLAPYYAEHQFATKIEKMMCEELGLDWNAYGRFLNEYITKNMGVQS
jgi:hypothetical protein